MSVSQIVTCDSCYKIMADSSVLHAMIVTGLDPASGSVGQLYFGVACGCAPRFKSAHDQLGQTIRAENAAALATPQQATPQQATPQQATPQRATP